MTTLRTTVILVSLSMAALAARQAPPVAQPAMITSSIEIEGATLRVRASFAGGVVHRGPVVVFESGADRRHHDRTDVATDVRIRRRRTFRSPGCARRGDQ